MRMTARQIARLAFKLLAVWTAVEAIRALPNLSWGISAIITGATGSGPLFQNLVTGFLASAPPLILAIVALVLWRRAGVLAAIAVGHDLQDDQDEPDSAPTPAALSALHAILLSSLGAWVLVDSIPESFRYAADFIAWVASGAPTQRSWLLTFHDWRLLGLIIRLILGVYLFFGANGIVSFLRRVRRIGLEPGEDPLAGASQQTERH